jgi:hypothetical protein
MNLRSTISRRSSSISACITGAPSQSVSATLGPIACSLNPRARAALERRRLGITNSARAPSRS